MALHSVCAAVKKLHTHSLVWTCGMVINDDAACIKHCSKQWVWWTYGTFL